MPPTKARLALLLLALAAAVVCLVALLASKRPKGVDDESRDDAEAVAATTVAPLAAAPREASTPAPEPARRDEKPVGRWLTVTVLDFDKLPRPGAIVRVDIERPPRIVTEATASPQDETPTGLSLSANEDGVAQFDVATLPFDAESRALAVTAETFDRLPGRARVALPTDRARGSALAETFDLTVVVTLVEGTLVRGVVCEEHGTPIPNAHVTAAVDGPESGGTRTASDGTYTVVLPKNTKEAILIAFVTGRRPGGLKVMLHPGGVTDVPPVILAPGETIAGKVIGRGNGGRVRVAWYGATRNSHGIVWDSTVIALCDEQPVIATAWPAVDEKGLFHVDGLERGPHRVRVEPVEAPVLAGPAPVVLPDLAKSGYSAAGHGKIRGERFARPTVRTGDWNVHPNALARSDVMADATSKSVELSVERSILQLTVAGFVARDAPVWASVSDAVGTLALRLAKPERGDAAEATFVVRAGARMTVSAACDECEPVTQGVDSPASGEMVRVTIDLRRRRVPLERNERSERGRHYDPNFPADWKIEPPTRARLGTAGPDGVAVSVPWELRDDVDHVFPAELALLEADRFVICNGQTPWTDDGTLVTNIVPALYKARLGRHPFLYRFVELRVGSRYQQWGGGSDAPPNDSSPVHVVLVCR